MVRRERLLVSADFADLVRDIRRETGMPATGITQMMVLGTRRGLNFDIVVKGLRNGNSNKVGNGKKEVRPKPRRRQDVNEFDLFGL